MTNYTLRIEMYERRKTLETPLMTIDTVSGSTCRRLQGKGEINSPMKTAFWPTYKEGHQTRD